MYFNVPGYRMYLVPVLKYMDVLQGTDYILSGASNPRRSMPVSITLRVL